MPETREVELRIVLEDPTPGVWGGIQFGSGSKATVKEWQKMSGPEARFTATAQIRITPSPCSQGEGAGGEGVPKSAGRYVLTGPVIQKDGKGRFLYIVWRDHVGIVSRRAKIYVESIDRAMIDKATPSSFPRGTSLERRKGPGDGGQTEKKVRFEILLPGRAKDCLPCCATVKPIRDWRPTND